MNPIVHAGIGWLIAQPLEQKRARLLVTLAAVAPDVDGLPIVFGERWYAELHHRLAHGLLAAACIPPLVLVATRSPKAAALALLAFHSHVAADLAGSGPGWPLWYLWPFSDVEWLPAWQWDLASWQNSLIGLAVILACLGGARWFGRTPLELVNARAEKAVVAAVQARVGSAARPR